MGWTEPPGHPGRPACYEPVTYVCSNALFSYISVAFNCRREVTSDFNANRPLVNFAAQNRRPAGAMTLCIMPHQEPLVV